MERSYFNITDLLPIALTLVVAGIGIAYGLNVIGDVKDDMVTGAAGCNATAKTSCGGDYNATVDTITGVSKLTTKLPLIVTVVVAALVIGILVRYLMRP